MTIYSMLDGWWCYKPFTYNAQKITIYAILVGWYWLVIYLIMIKHIKNVHILPRI